MRNLLFCFFIVNCSFYEYAQDLSSDLKDAREFFQKKSYDNAYKVYLKIDKKLKNKNPYFNEIGQAAYKAKDYTKASSYFLKAKKSNKSKQSKIDLNYNLGNSYYQQKEYQKAIESYKNVLRKKPNDEQTRYNLALAMKQLKKNQQNQKSPQPPSPQKPPTTPPQNKKDDSNKSNNNSSISDQKTDQMLDDLMKKEMDTKKKKTKNKPALNHSQTGKDW